MLAILSDHFSKNLLELDMDTSRDLLVLVFSECDFASPPISPPKLCDANFSTNVIRRQFLHQCYTTPISPPMLYNAKFSTNVTRRQFLHQCYTTPFSPPMLYDANFSTNVIRRQFLHQCYTTPYIMSFHICLILAMKITDLLMYIKI